MDWLVLKLGLLWHLYKISINIGKSVQQEIINNKIKISTKPTLFFFDAKKPKKLLWGCKFPKRIKIDFIYLLLRSVLMYYICTFIYLIKVVNYKKQSTLKL